MKFKLTNQNSGCGKNYAIRRHVNCSQLKGPRPSSVLMLDQPNYYAYFYLKGKHLSRAYETWQAVSYRYCYNFSKMSRTTFLSRDPKSTYNSYIFHSKMGNIQPHYINLVS